MEKQIRYWALYSEMLDLAKQGVSAESVAQEYSYDCYEAFIYFKRWLISQALNMK